jgi:hypothetical protein
MGLRASGTTANARIHSQKRRATAHFREQKFPRYES